MILLRKLTDVIIFLTVTSITAIVGYTWLDVAFDVTPTEEDE